MLAMLQHDVGKHVVHTVGLNGKCSTIGNVHGRQTFRSSVERNRLVATLEECGIHIRRDHPRAEVRERGSHATNSAANLQKRRGRELVGWQTEVFHEPTHFIVTRSHEVRQRQTLSGFVVEDPSGLTDDVVRCSTTFGLRAGGTPRSELRAPVLR